MKRTHVLLRVGVSLVVTLGLSSAIFAQAIGNPNCGNGWNSNEAAAVGNPGQANGCSSNSVVSIPAFSSEKSSGAPRPWSRTIDGSGLDGGSCLLHDNSPNTVGFSGNAAENIVRGGTVPGYVWVEYDLGSVLNLGDMWVWNYNELNFPHFGMNEVTIEYSTTGSTTPADWTTIYDGVIPLSLAGGLGDSAVDLVVDFNSAAARYVVITTDDPPFHNHKVSLLPEWEPAGLSEVRFNFPAAVKASASSQHVSGSRGPINTINGSGIDPNGTCVGNDHDNLYYHLWISGNLATSAANPHLGTVAGSHWVRYDFDQAYEMDRMWIWNYNELNFPTLGMRDVTIEYASVDDPNVGDWTTIYDGEIPEADGGGVSVNSLVDLEVPFGGVFVKHVVITADTGALKNWDPSGLLEEVGLSEVRFFSVPTNCAEAIAAGYGLAGDTNDDCSVNLVDLGSLVGSWLDCVKPDDPTCLKPWE